MGHKPSYGIVPAHGQIPGPPGTLTQADLAVGRPDGPHRRRPRARPRRSWPGPTAGTVAGVAPRAAAAARHRRLAGYRIAAWLDDPRCPVEPEVRALLEGAGGRAGRGRARRVDADARPGFTLAKAADALLPRCSARPLPAAYTRDAIERFAADDRRHARRADPPAHRHAAPRLAESANERRLQMRLRFEEFFDRLGRAAAARSCRAPAIPHDHTEPMAARTRALRRAPSGPTGTLIRGWRRPAPATCRPRSCPVGLTAAGLPVGIQIVGPYLHDRTTLDLAAPLAERSAAVPARRASEPMRLTHPPIPRLGLGSARPRPRPGPSRPCADRTSRIGTDWRRRQIGIGRGGRRHGTWPLRSTSSSQRRGTGGRLVVATQHTRWAIGSDSRTSSDRGGPVPRPSRARGLTHAGTPFAGRAQGGGGSLPRSSA